MDKSKEKIKENPIVANRAIYMANPCHIIDKVVPLYWHNSYTNEKSSDNHRLSELFSLDYQDSNLDKQNCSITSCATLPRRGIISMWSFIS